MRRQMYRSGLLSRLLIYLGCLCIGVGVGIYAMSYYNDWRYIQAAQRPAVLPTVIAEQATEVPAAPPAQQPLVQPQATIVPTPQAVAQIPVPASASKPPPLAGDKNAAAHSQTEKPQPTTYIPAGEPVWMSIPSISLETVIQPVGVRNGAYDVPSYAVGYQNDSALPGTAGNTILNGHVESINAGNVFARLDDLKPGERIVVYGTERATVWEITGKTSYPYRDGSWLVDTTQPQLTLYTCTGTFDYLIREYDHRLVVTARLLESQPLGDFRFHVVQPGEALSTLAAKYYGDPNLWWRIYDANREQIQTPSVLHPGMLLRIPK